MKNKMIGWFEFQFQFDIEVVVNVELEVMTDGVKYYGYSNGDTVNYVHVLVHDFDGSAIHKIQVIGDEFFLLGQKISAVKCEYPKDSKWAHPTESIYSRGFLLMENGQVFNLIHYPNGRCLVNENGTLKALEDIKTGIVRVAYHKFLNRK